MKTAPGPGQDALFSAAELPEAAPAPDRPQADIIREAVRRCLTRQPMLTVTQIAVTLRLPMPLGVALVGEQLAAMETDREVRAHSEHCDPKGLIVPKWEAL